MSYHIYTIEGYGVRTTNLPVPDTQQTINIATVCGKQLTQKIMGCIVDGKINFDEYEGGYNCMCGLTAFLADVIYDLYNVQLTPCEDFNSEKFLLYEPSYPWTMNASDAHLTPHLIDKYITNTIEMYTNQKLDLGYFSVENGG